MGAVYRAQEPELDRPVAIKVIKRSFLRELGREKARKMRRRFLQEARAAARLNHPCVVSIYGVGTERGWPYMVMEWVDAISLEEGLNKHGRVPLEDVVQIGVQVLDALSVAHREGIIHRDIKPGNIMLSPDGQVKLVDFGVAQMKHSDLAKTMPGQIMGTPWYAAPEQLEAGSVDARSDLYGLSAVLYEALTGEPPFPYDSMMRVLYAHQSEEIAELHERVPQVPADFCAVVMRGLRKAPDERFASAAAMKQAIRNGVSVEPVSTVGSAVRAAEMAETLDALPEVAMVRLERAEPEAMLQEVASRWEASYLGATNRRELFEDLSRRPLASEPFCGVVEASGVWLLVGDGLIHGAFDTESGCCGDEAVETLPKMPDTTLYPIAEDWPTASITLMASAMQDRPSMEGGLDSSITDLVQLQGRLQREDFDGVLWLRSAQGLGWVLFRNGERVIDLFAGSWGGSDDGRRWESWIHQVSARAWVQEWEPRFPAVTFQQQLRGMRLDIKRGGSTDTSSVREDAVSEARNIELVPSRQSQRDKSRGQSTLAHLFRSDPAWQLCRYGVVDIPLQFRRHGRHDRWRRMLEGIPALDTVTLHEPQPLGSGGERLFDAVTRDGQDRVRHLLRRVAMGTAEAVDCFVNEVIDAREHPDEGAHIDGAILMAPAFDDEALEEWLNRLDEANGGLFRSALDAWRHQEGLFYTEAGPVHILLVEEDEDGSPRPMMPAG